MNWLTNFVRPKIQALVNRTEIPDNLWKSCPGCEQMLFHRDLAENYYVCRHCNHHMRLSGRERVRLLCDEGSMVDIEIPTVPADPLKFKDIKKYTDRMKDARAKTGATEAITVVKGTIDGKPLVIAAFDFSFMGGSMGLAVGEGLVAASQAAIAHHAPLIAIPSSGGARMQEGILSLMQMPRTTIAVTQVKEAGLPFITILADPTTGGVSASFAMLGDIALAEPGAMIAFTGARVIQETLRQKLPEGFQTSEFLLEHGIVDRVVPRSQLRPTLSKLTSMLCHSPLN